MLKARGPEEASSAVALSAQPLSLPQHTSVSAHPFPLSTSFHSVWSPHQRFPRWPTLPVPAVPALPGKWGILAKGAALTRSSPAPSPPPPPGRLDHKARAAAAEPSSQRPSDGCALPCPPPARSLPEASKQRPTPAKPRRHCRLHSPQGAEESPCRPHARPRPPSSCCTWSCSRGSGRAPRPHPRVSGFLWSPLHPANCCCPEIT